MTDQQKLKNIIACAHAACHDLDKHLYAMSDVLAEAYNNKPELRPQITLALRVFVTLRQNLINIFDNAISTLYLSGFNWSEIDDSRTENKS